MTDNLVSRGLRTDLGWGGIALVAALSGFALGELSAVKGGLEGSQAAALKDPSRAVVPSPSTTASALGGDLITASTSSPPTPRAPAAPRPLAEGKAPANRQLALPTPRAFLADARPTPALAIPLDPLAEALVRTLLRVRGLERSHTPIQVLSDLVEQAPLAGKHALLLALTAYFPQVRIWPDALPTTREYVLARHAYHLQDPPDPERLSFLHDAISLAPPGVLEFAWLERLSEAHVLNGTFDQTLIQHSPERAAAVFAARKGGLTSGRRFDVAKSLANRNPRRAAALALSYLSEEWDYRLLVLARRHDPALALEFAREHVNDPRFRSAQALSDLEQSSDRCYESRSLADWYRHLNLAERTWRAVLPRDLGHLLELISWEGAWTPLQARITEFLLTSGDEDLAWSGFSDTPPTGKVAALARGWVSFETDYARAHLMDACYAAPLSFDAELDLFLGLVPRLPLSEALDYALLFQDQGSPEAARRVLDRTRTSRSEGALVLSEAKLALAQRRPLREVLDHFEEEIWEED